jgi:hypothetical protein
MPHVEAVQLFDRFPEKTKSFDWAGKALSSMGQDFAAKSFQKNALYYLKKLLT